MAFALGGASLAFRPLPLPPLSFFLTDSTSLSPKLVSMALEMVSELYRAGLGPSRGACFVDTTFRYFCDRSRIGFCTVIWATGA